MMGGVGILFIFNISAILEDTRLKRRRVCIYAAFYSKSNRNYTIDSRGKSDDLWTSSRFGR